MTPSFESRSELYIGGQWVPPASGATIDVENPATEQVIASVPAGSAADVNAAVRAARTALDGWAHTAPDERAAALHRLYLSVEKRADEFAATIATEMGCPLRIATKVQTGTPLRVLRSCVELATSHPFTETIGNSLVVKEPIGVVAAITPWNYPLQQVVAKIGPALAAGCTVVLKPSELTPLTAYLLFDAVHEAGLPPGVLNLMPGTGPAVGEVLTGHPDVDMVSFTGSAPVGRRVGEVVSGRLARVALELGGKSANVVLDDADLVAAVKVGIANAFLNSGQTCTAWTRMLVHRSRYDEAVELTAESVAKYTVGDPFDEQVRLGPLVSEAQLDRVTGYLARGLSDGARLVAGGPDVEVPDTGYFVAPTVFADVDPDSVLAQEEIFGPVLAIMPFADDDEAVAVANNSVYGLSGGVWSADAERALAVARRMQTGSVDINGAKFNPMAPFGGYKHSGVGRELGPYGVEEFLQPKAIQR
jgi:aldehyde dehydrogenase (NAD+)